MFTQGVTILHGFYKNITFQFKNNTQNHAIYIPICIRLWTWCDSEQFVIQLLQRIKNETAVLILTHRLFIVRNAERIYILKNGQIEEVGNQIQLLKNDNLYPRSWMDWKAT